MPAKTTVDQAVVTTLRQSQFQGNNLILPCGINRSHYTKVKEIIERCGGKWDRRADAHVFPGDALAALRSVIEDGTAVPKNPLAFFETPPDVAQLMIAEACLAPMYFRAGTPRFLEPNGGHGALIRAMQVANAGAIITTAEIDASNADILRRDFPDVRVFQVDFLKMNDITLTFDRVVMNPPFAVEGNPLAYIDHIRHAYSILEPVGRLVAIAPAGFTFRKDRKCADFRAFVQRHGYYTELAPNAFKESGTGVQTVMITLEE